MTSFLHQRCKAGMCTDCILIAEEYQDLLEARTRALGAAEYEVRKLRQELDNAKRRADLFEQVAKAGLPQVITAWMDKDISKLLKGEAMIEYVVTLKNGIAYVYAERYVVFDGYYQFYRGEKVVIKFETASVVDVQQTVSKEGELSK